MELIISLLCPKHKSAQLREGKGLAMIVVPLPAPKLPVGARGCAHKADNTALVLTARDMDRRERRRYERK